MRISDLPEDEQEYISCRFYCWIEFQGTKYLAIEGRDGLVHLGLLYNLQYLPICVESDELSITAAEPDWDEIEERDRLCEDCIEIADPFRLMERRN